MLTSEQIQHFRAETPGTAHRIHLNNAGAALMPQPVIDAIQRHFQLEIEIGGYEAEAAAQSDIEEYYNIMSRFLNCEPANIAYAANATDAYNRALSSIPFEEDDVILTTMNDYVSNQIAFLELHKRYGIRLVRVEDAPEGGVDVDLMRDLIKKYEPTLVAVTHVPTNSGLVQPVEAIGEICEEEEVLYLVDACQSAGQIPLDVHKIKCDFLSATFRKFLRGPRGAGFLYVSNRALELGMEPLFVDLHSATWIEPNLYELGMDARRFELWERPHSLMLGSKACVEYALGVGLENIEHRVKHLADLTRQKLSALPGVRVLDQGVERCGIVTAWVAGQTPGQIKAQLVKANINTSFQRLPNAVIDFAEKGVDWALRVSPHYYNTEEDIETLIQTLSDLS